MNTPIRNDDFFTPSLDERHNLEGVKEPWDPGTIVWSSFLVGPGGAAVLVFLNNNKLGIHNKNWLMLVVVTIIASLQLVEIDLGIRELGSGNWRLFINALTVVVTLLATRPQKIRFRIFESEGGEPKSLFLPGLLAFLAGLALLILSGRVLDILLGILETYRA